MKLSQAVHCCLDCRLLLLGPLVSCFVGALPLALFEVGSHIELPYVKVGVVVVGARQTGGADPNAAAVVTHLASLVQIPAFL